MEYSTSKMIILQNKHCLSRSFSDHFCVIWCFKICKTVKKNTNMDKHGSVQTAHCGVFKFCICYRECSDLRSSQSNSTSSWSLSCNQPQAFLVSIDFLHTDQNLPVWHHEHHRFSVQISYLQQQHEILGESSESYPEAMRGNKA